MRDGDRLFYETLLNDTLAEVKRRQYARVMRAKNDDERRHIEMDPVSVPTCSLAMHCT